MRQTPLFLLVVVAGFATSASAAIVFDFEDQAYGSHSAVTSTVSGLTVTITRNDGWGIDVTGPVGPASWMAHSLLAYPTGTPSGLTANFSAPVSMASIQFGDYDADSDTGVLTAYAGLGGTGAVLGTNSLFYPSSMDITYGDPDVGTLSVSALGIRSIVFTSTGNYPDSVYWDNLHADTGSVPEPTTIIVWSLLGDIAITLGWRRRKTA
jgi:hypothetical protein